jgi:transcription elongation GreA/GreB family factor
MNLKETLFKQCETYVNNRLQTVEDIMLDNQKALQSETKSSAGDKHETGRAMLQLEMEKASQQLSGILQMKEILAKTDIHKTSKIGRLGSIVYTQKATYFLSISAGKLTACGNHFFAISVSSPLGKLLLGKQEKDVIVFNENTIRIVEVV